MKAFTKLSLIALLLTGFSFSMINCLKFSGELDRSPVRGGETVTMTLNMKLEDGFHIYSVHPDMSLSPTYVDFADSSMFSQFGIMEEPDPHMKFDENFGQVIGYHENRFKLSQQLVISPDLDPGKYQIEATLAYLACDATRCIPKWDDFKVNLDIESGSARPDYKLAVVTDYPSAVAGTESAGSGDADSGEVNLNAEIEKGLLNFLLLAFSMGLLVLLTPCVFPMIPITVSFFAQQGENEGGRPVLSAAVYALGIVVIYSAIGMILSVTLGASGANMIASNPWVNLFIALLFIVFTLSLFGMFELQVPSALRQFSLSQEQKGGMLGVLFMAFTFTLTSFTCTVQFVGLLLVAASQGAFFWPLVGMIAFSSAFALPFFFLALFPQYLSKLPRSGGWLNSVKVVMGFVIAAASLKFLSNVNLVWGWGIFTRQVVLSVWVVLAFLLGMYLIGKIRLPHDSKLEVIGVPRFFLSIIVFAFSLYLAAGLLGRPLHGLIDTYLPHDFSSSVSTVSESGGERHTWIEDMEAGLAQAKKENKPIFLEFSGHTCTNCRWMESNIFTDFRVQSHFKDFVLVRLFTDLGDGAKTNQKLQADRFGTVALPYYVILDKDNGEITRFPGMDRDVNKFLAFLEKGKQK